MDMTAIPATSENDAKEEPWALPAGWCWTPLKSVTSFIGRGRSPAYVEQNGVPVVNQKCVRWHRLDLEHLRLTARDAFDRLSPELRLRRGDLLWNSTGTGTIGRATVYDGSIEELTADSHVTIVRPVEIDPRYLGYFVETGRVQHLVDEGHVGSTNQRELPRAFVEELLLPIAPLAEQHRIVERIDSLFAEIAEGEAALEDARKGLEIFRRALLKAAVTGELTRDWRENNQPNETSHDLLARIKADRDATPKSGRGKKAAASPPLDTSDLQELPEGWAWATLDEIASSVRNGTSAAPRATRNGHEILRISAVRPLRIDETQIRYLSEDQIGNAREAMVVAGDLLFTRYNGSADLVGVGAMYTSIPRYYPDKIIRVRLHNELHPHANFVEIAVNTGSSRKHIAANIKTTAGQQGLSGESLKGTPIPIPPSTEALEISKRVAQALTSFSDCYALLEAGEAEAARLRQAILKSAFEGTLVPQVQADEPASVMLKRLKESAPTAKAGRRGRAKARHGS